MKKPLKYTALLVIPALGFLVTRKEQISQISSKSMEAGFFCCSGWKEKTGTTWEKDTATKTGRQLTYFWAEQAET